MKDRQPTLIKLFNRMNLPELNKKTYKYPEDELTLEIANTTINTKENINAYAALFFDGEGCIRTDENKRNNPPSISLQIMISSTDLEILTKLKQEFGGSVAFKGKAKEHHKNQWIWRIRDRDTLKKFLSQILPYSTIKKPQIELGLKFLEITTNTKYCRGGTSQEEYNIRKAFHEEFKRLKHTELSQCKLDAFNKQINEMNIDKGQPTLSKWFDFDEKSTIPIKKEIEPEKPIPIVRRITDVEAAGIFDGEGCIRTLEDKRKNLPTILLIISLTNTDLPILTKLKDRYGGEIYIKKKTKGKEHYKQSWFWYISDRDTIKKFLTQILPYTQYKKPQIELGLRFLELVKNSGKGKSTSIEEYRKRKLIADKLKELKHTELSACELNDFNTQIKEMKVDRLQKTMLDL